MTQKIDTVKQVLVSPPGLPSKNKKKNLYLHEVLVNDIVTFCTNSRHSSFSADIPQISTIETLKSESDVQIIKQMI